MLRRSLNGLISASKSPSKVFNGSKAKQLRDEDEIDISKEDIIKEVAYDDFNAPDVYSFRDVLPESGLGREEQQLADNVSICTAKGNFSTAARCQEQLIGMLMERQERDQGTAQRWQPILEYEINRMDELREFVRTVQQPAPPGLPVVVEGASPVRPNGGCAQGGTLVQWIGESPAPKDLHINGKPCAALAGGKYLTPACPSTIRAGSVSCCLLAVSSDGTETVYPAAFTYKAEAAEAAEVAHQKASSGPIDGSVEVTSSPSEVRVSLSETSSPGFAEIKVSSPQEKTSLLREGLSSCTSDAFGFAGKEIELRDSGRTAVCIGGGLRKVCLGQNPLRRFPEGHYFEIEVGGETSRSSRALAIGVTTRTQDGHIRQGYVQCDEAKTLERAWIAGYERGGGVFFSDGEELKMPSNSWRPAVDVAPGVRLGVLLTEPIRDDTEQQPRLRIYQNGELRADLRCRGRVPQDGEDLYALVDLQGGVKKISFVTDATPPEQPLCRYEFGNSPADRGRRSEPID